MSRFSPRYTWLIHIGKPKHFLPAVLVLAATAVTHPEMEAAALGFVTFTLGAVVAALILWWCKPTKRKRKEA